MATLETISKMGPLQRIKALNDYIQKGDTALSQARTLRIQTVAQLRKDKDPATWRRLSEMTGLSEQHLRTAIDTLTNKRKRRQP